MSGTKHHVTGLGKGPEVDPYSLRLEEQDKSDQERIYHYAQLRTAMKHLVPENARLKRRVEILEIELRRLSRIETRLREKCRALECRDPALVQALIRSGESDPAVTQD